MMNGVIGLLLAVLGGSVLAQDQAAQRELMRRQQESDAFVQQLRQQQELVKMPPGDLSRRGEVEIRQFGERQRLNQASEQQLRDVRPDLPPDLRTYERLKAEQERRVLIAPAEVTN